MSAAFLVSNSAKIGNALTAASAAPAVKTGRRPIRSERFAAPRITKKPTTAATSRALRATVFFRPSTVTT